MQLEIERAKWFAIGAHGQQKRKYTNEPYWFHLENGYQTLTQFYNDTDALIVAWLHDVVEDTSFTNWQIGKFFGEKIGKYVADITKPPGKNRDEQNAAYKKQLANSSFLVQTVKYADLLDNTLKISSLDPDFAKIYLQEKRELLPMIDKGDPALYKLVCKQVGL